MEPDTTTPDTPAVASIMDELTLADMEDLETALGYPLGQTGEHLGSGPRASAAVLWIRKRRTDPAFTFDQARQLTVTQAAAMTEQLAALEDGPAVPPIPSTIA